MLCGAEGVSWRKGSCESASASCRQRCGRALGLLVQVMYLADYHDAAYMLPRQGDTKGMRTDCPPARHAFHRPTQACNQQHHAKLH